MSPFFQGAIALSLRVGIEDVLLVIIVIILSLQIIVVLSSAISTRFRRRRPARTPQHPNYPSVFIGNNEVRIFTYGVDLYSCMLKDIQDAKQVICIESFIWKGDHIGQAFKDAVIAKAEEGVAVYVIFDAFANIVVNGNFKHFPPSVHLFRYKAWTRLLDVVDPRRWARDHKKLLVIDEEIGYIGGYNIGDLYGATWRDTHVRIQGSAAQNLSASFLEFWNEHATMDTFTCKRNTVLEPHIRLYVNNPTRILFPIRAMYIEAIDLAKERILLITPYFIPDHFVLASLIRAAQRGVDVQLIIPERSNHLLADWLARTYFTDCLKKGIRIFLYQDAMIHAKTATIDSTWVTVGTANLDRLSMLGNHELNIEFFDPTLAEQVEIIFQADKTNCRELNLDEWIHRPFTQKLGELVLSPFWPFL